MGRYREEIIESRTERPNDPCTSMDWYKRTLCFLTVVSYDLYIDITLDPIKDRLTMVFRKDDSVDEKRI
jgi:hypothetical protein